ncbi:MAG: CpsD/CapB family tyrosine-protein kinase, partial [Janthinobacterium lividum]
RSRIAEAYRSFRTAVFGDRPAGSSQVLLVASARPAEGKATTCLNTAAALALQGHRVLIVNADMRRVSTPDAFGFSASRGLSECLTQSVATAEFIQPFHGVKNLFFLPAGTLPDHPSELLSSSRFCDVLDELRLNYEHILIDSPPALLFADTRILLSCVDAYVLVAQASHTAKRDLRRTMEELYGSSAAFLGVLFNGAKAKSPKYTKFGYGA